MIFWPFLLALLIINPMLGEGSRETRKKNFQMMCPGEGGEIKKIDLNPLFSQCPGPSREGLHSNNIMVPLNCSTGGGEYVLTSPNYPENYNTSLGNGYMCSYNFKLREKTTTFILIHKDEFETEENQDYLSIQGVEHKPLMDSDDKSQKSDMDIVKLTGKLSNDKEYVTTGKTLQIRFHSNNINSFKGFRLVIKMYCEGAWTKWTGEVCSPSCGVGLKNQTRKCIDGECYHGGDFRQVFCYNEPCPIGNWTNWVNGECSQTCGRGIITRTRVCEGGFCEGAAISYIYCQNPPCSTPSQGKEGKWAIWEDGECSKSCSTGTMIQTRNCTGGTCSQGLSTRVTPCNIELCPSPLKGECKAYLTNNLCLRRDAFPTGYWPLFATGDPCFASWGRGWCFISRTGAMNVCSKTDPKCGYNDPSEDPCPGNIEPQDDCSNSVLKPFCDLSPFNTFCSKCGKFGSGCGTVCNRVIVSQAEKDAFVKAHNDYRRKTAKGLNNRAYKADKQPMAKNMYELVWDDEIAMVAQALADQCVLSHDSGGHRRSPNYQSQGQNGYAAWYSGPFVKRNPAGYTASWFTETDVFSPVDVNKFKSENINAGHYTQVVWAKSRKIGCGYVSIKRENRKYAEYVFCNYWPMGNIINLPVYEPTDDPNEIGSMCPDGVNDGLCMHK